MDGMKSCGGGAAMPVAALVTIGLMLTHAQTQPAPPAFEVASVKPGDGDLGIDMKTFPTRLSSTCDLRQLITAAYTMENWQVTGGPAWLDSDLFDVEARTGEDLSGDRDTVLALGRPVPRKMMLMLQTLLAGRFNLKVHRETRQDNVFALVLAKGGPKLDPPKDTTRSYVGMGRGKVAWSADGRPDFSAATVIVTGDNASMGQLAAYLGGVMRRPVEDKTGIEGKYDFRIEYTPDDSSADTPAVSTALQRDAGLKLNATKGPVEFLVVDHAEKPSPN
jgi:uncharacterized protein (TIGR03435 family)